MYKAGTSISPPAARRKQDRQQDGFTLIELLVALVLIGLLVGVLVPRLPDLLGARLNSTGRFLSGTITYLYERAVTERTVLRLNLDLENHEYWVSMLGEENQFEEVEFDFAKRGKFRDPVRVSRVDTADRGAVESSVAVIHFFPNGFIEPATLHLSDGDRNNLTLQINPLTGEVRIHEGFKEFETRYGTLG